ncbi:flavin reductase (NADPH)-like [Panonychus citri]|uniref:flavin reductase (NADPH)-like n=1 Tax=Panonychus citri TaxID=50023 RepID=UPI002307A396|nr:flavin reductase (NADPH)-like [Panonychus citri]
MSPIRKIVIFGATGNTGLATVAKAIEKGLEVTAFVRDPSKLSGDLKVSQVISGDVTNPSDVDKAIAGQDGVVIVLGTRNDLGPSTIMSDGTKNIIDSMKNHGVNRVSACLSSFLYWEPEKIPPTMRNVHGDHLKMLDYLKNSGLDWVVLCPPHIDNNPSDKQYVLKKEERVGAVISKFDLGDALVSVLLTNDWLNTKVGIGY